MNKKIIIYFLISNSFLFSANFETNILNILNQKQINLNTDNFKNNDNKNIKIDKYLEISKSFQEKKKLMDNINKKTNEIKELEKKFLKFRNNYSMNTAFISFGKQYFKYLTALYKKPYIDAKNSVITVDDKKLKTEVLKNIKKAYSYYYYYYKVFYFLPNFFKYDIKKINKLPNILRIAFEIKDTELYLNFFKYFIKDPVMFEKNYGNYARNILDKYYENLKPYIKPLKNQEKIYKKYIQENKLITTELLNDYILSEYIIYNNKIKSNIKNIAVLNLEYLKLLIYTRNVNYLRQIKAYSNWLNKYIIVNPTYKIEYIIFYKKYRKYYYYQLPPLN